MTLWLSVVLGVAIVLAALSAAAETSLTSVSRVRTRARREAGDGRAGVVEELQRRPEGFLGAILVINTVTLIMASASATLLVSTHLGAGYGFWSAIALAVVVLIFCELGPKSYALEHNDAVARFMAPAVLGATVVLRPLVWLLTGIVSGLSVVLPGRGQLRAPFLTEDELKALISASEQEGVVEEEEREMIHGVLEMTDKSVREVMVPRVQMVALPGSATADEAIAQVLEHGHSRIPVYQETIDNVVGVVYAKDLLRATASAGRKDPLTVADLVRPATFVPEAKHLGELLQEMQLAKIHLAVVVDEYGGTAGLATIEDLLEEIVGPIRDEYDWAEQEEIQLVSPCEAVLSASTSLDDVNDLLHLHLEGEDFDSVGGLVYARLGRIPVVGDELEAGEGVTITVTAVDKRAPRTLRLRRELPFELEEPEPEGSGPSTAASGTG